MLSLSHTCTTLSLLYYQLLTWKLEGNAKFFVRGLKLAQRNDKDKKELTSDISLLYTFLFFPTFVSFFKVSS